MLAGLTNGLTLVDANPVDFGGHGDGTRVAREDGTTGLGGQTDGEDGSAV
ncbi:MAG: hypothetical protein VYE68_16345 [Acidobacteriota bacterium]|nr:hypothetical protein [Acidobacteriota bacterium]